MFYNVFKNRNYANFECNNVKSKIKSTQINKTISFYRKNSTLFNAYVCFFVNIRALES